jgi:uncharacterized protein (DUF488 family)
MNLFTIGHSNHSIAEFIALLQQHKITALADVRSHPYSRYLTHFSQDALKKALQEVAIAYVFLGNELGARPRNQNCYVNGKAIYKNIAATSEFAAGIERICQGAERYQIALMCAEQDPITCHRAILVCPYLKDRGLKIQHIGKNGDLENHDLLEARLLKIHQLNPAKEIVNSAIQLSLPLALDNSDDLSQDNQDLATLSPGERLIIAYRLQGEKIAYLDKNLAAEQHEGIN